MFTPYAYSSEKPSYNEDKMLDILSAIDKKYCDCDYGAAGAGVGYLSPGTCLDYAFDVLKVPYSFAFEIYSEMSDIPAARKGSAFLQVNKKSKDTKKILEKHLHSHSCFLQTSASTNK
jgi:hypothetical protein